MATRAIGVGIITSESVELSSRLKNSSASSGSMSFTMSTVTQVDVVPAVKVKDWELRTP